MFTLFFVKLKVSQLNYRKHWKQSFHVFLNVSVEHWTYYSHRRRSSCTFTMTEFSELYWIIFYRNVVFQLSSCPAWIHHREWGVHVRKCLCASVCVCLCPCASVYDVFTRCCGHECSQITVTPPRFFRGHRPAFGLTFIGLSRKANSTCVSPSSISLSVEGEKGGESMPAKSSTHTHNPVLYFYHHESPSSLMSSGLRQYLEGKPCGSLSSVHWD